MEIILGIIAACGTLFAVSVVVRPGTRLRRILKQANRVRISKIIDGQKAKVTGIVEPGKTLLTAPLSGRKCSAFCLRVEEEKCVGSNPLDWVCIDTISQSTAFTLRDKSGCALVDPVDSECSIVMDRSTHKASTGIVALLSARPGFDDDWQSERVLRYEEGVVEEGERVSVLGQARRLSVAEAKDHSIVVSKSKNGVLLISDAPGVHDSPASSMTSL